MKKILYSILLLCSLGCANIIPPQGGPMDNIAPSIMYGQCIPDSLHLTNYKEKTIVIAINEEFKIQGLNTEMKTNPALIKPVEYKIKKVSKKKSNLIITFQEELKTNTTYTLDFGRSINPSSIRRSTLCQRFLNIKKSLTMPTTLLLAPP